MKKKIRNIAVLASGNGTTLQALIDAIQDKVLNINVSIVLSDKENSFALTRARSAGIPTYVLKNQTLETRDNELYEILTNSNIDMVVLAGYLKLIGPKVIKKFTIINTHPSLLPKYGGKGMHGMNVHKAVVDNNEKESGVTLHFVNEDYDKGEIIWQTHIPVYAEDTASDVSERVQLTEKVQLIYVLKAFSEGKINIPEKDY